jgi:outer membrane immunogenic protein
MKGKFSLAKIAAAAAVAIGLSVPAGAADLVVRHRRAPPPPPPVYVPLYNWTGFYVGAHFGGSFAHESDTLGALGLSTDPSGVLGGFQVGYNWQFAPSLVVGVEAEFSWTSASGTAGFGVPGFAGVLTSNHNWYDTLAGRIGFTQGGPWLFYAKIGGAWMNGDLSVPGASINISRNGWVTGAGVEYMFSPTWSGKFEYSYLDFGSGGVGFGPFGGNVNTQVNEFKVGLNYHLPPGILFGRW